MGEEVIGVGVFVDNGTSNFTRSDPEASKPVFFKELGIVGRLVDLLVADIVVSGEILGKSGHKMGFS